jgi:hypothetical protein
MRPPEVRRGSPEAPSNARSATDHSTETDLTAAAYEVDLFGEPVEASEPIIPRRDTAGYLAHLHTLRLPNGWQFSSTAPRMTKMPDHVDSIWVIDHEGEFRHLFVDNRNGREWFFDPADGWST